MKINKLRFLHIAYVSNNKWGYGIWNKIHAIEMRNTKYKLDSSLSKRLGNIMLSISTRLDMILVLVSEINNKYSTIIKHVKKRDKSKDQYAFGEISNKTVLSFLVNIDSFVFETRSCCELIEKFSKVICRNYININCSSKSKELPGTDWENTEWYKKLHLTRISFFHDIAPFLAIDTTGEPKKYDVLFSKENIHDYNSNNNYIRLTELNEIYNGFGKGVMKFQEHIINQIENMK